MDLSLTEDQELIKNSVDKFILESYDSDTRRKTIKNNIGSDLSVWKNFSELGWLSLPFSEEDGGFGGGLVDIMILMRSFGRGLVIEPFISTVIMSGAILSACPKGLIRNNVIEKIISGDAKVSFAHSEPRSRFNLSDISTTASLENNEWIINGHKCVVFGGAQADYILLAARTNGDRYEKEGISIFLLDKNVSGLNIQDYPTVDGFKAAEIHLNNVKLPKENLISIENKSYKVIESAVNKTLVAVAAESSGIMEKMYEMTLEYIKTRKQFGVAIGKFQAIQHRAVEMLILSDEMNSLSSMAALKGVDNIAALKSVYASKIHIGTGGRTLAEESIQMHGGMGVTEEMEIGQYFKRLIMLDTFLGNSDYYLDLYSNLD